MENQTSLDITPFDSSIIEWGDNACVSPFKNLQSLSAVPCEDDDDMASVSASVLPIPQSPPIAPIISPIRSPKSMKSPPAPPVKEKSNSPSPPCYDARRNLFSDDNGAHEENASPAHSSFLSSFGLESPGSSPLAVPMASTPLPKKRSGKRDRSYIAASASFFLVSLYQYCNNIM